VRNKILKFTDKITTWHFKIFNYVAKKSKTSVWFTFLLLFLAIYEIAEHFIIPILLIYLGTK